MARAPSRIPATTNAAFNRLTTVALFTAGMTGLVGYFLGTKPTTDNSQQGISNTAIVVGSIAALLVAYFMSGRSGGGD